MALAAVRDLRPERQPPSLEELADFETDVMAGFVLARASAGLVDATIRGDVGHLGQVRVWFGRPLWDMQPADADDYFGRVLRETAKGTRLARAQALRTYFLFLELRHKVEIYNLTGRVFECPIDELNRPRGGAEAKLRIPPTTAEVDQLFAGWRQELASCRKFAPTARNYAAARLMAEVGLRANETLVEWLQHRRTRWPTTANRHLIINQRTALDDRAVSKVWLTQALRGQAATLERLRVDRQLDEALTYGPDPLHLAAVFGLDDKTAIRYAAAARQILESGAERHAAHRHPDRHQ